ncbi:hypothetical protein M8J77_015555 [Diaphorina citri]|nr:hypothetical protein M8J77_015555 [Diaphorina citri]
MSVCNSCGGDLPLDGGHVVCGVCGGGLHYGCSTVSEASWRSMSNPSKAKWKCGECRGRSNYLLQRTGSFNSLSGNLTDGGGTQESRKKDDTITLSKMDALLDRKFKAFKEDVEKSLNFMSGTVDDLSKSFKNLEQKIITMEKKQEKLETQNQELRKRVKTLEVMVQDMAQAGNQCKVEISNVPTNVEDSDFTDKLFEKASVNNIAKKGDYQIEKVQKYKPDRTPMETKNLVVTFKNKEIRNAVMETLKKERQKLNTTGILNRNPPQPIFVNEYLTPYLKKVFFEAKKIKQDKNYEFLWVKHGQILLKKQQGAKIIRLSCLEDLSKI